MHRHDMVGRRRWLLRTAGVWQTLKPVGRGLEKARGNRTQFGFSLAFSLGCAFSRPLGRLPVGQSSQNALSSCAASTEASEVVFLFIYLCMCVFIWWVVLGVNNCNPGRTLKQLQSLRQPKLCTFLPPSDLSDEPLGGSSKNLASHRKS